MEKRKLRIYAIGILAVGIAVALSGGAINAWFSDTERSDGNKFTAGSLNLQVGPDDPWASKIITNDVTDGYPNMGDSALYVVKNTGTITGTLNVTIVLTENKENTMIEPEVEAGDTTGTPTTGEDTAGELGGIMMVRLWVEKGGATDKYDEGTDVSIYYDNLVNFNNAGERVFNFATTTGEENHLKPGDSNAINVGISWEVPYDTTSKIQTDSVSFDIIFKLSQIPSTP